MSFFIIFVKTIFIAMSSLRCCVITSNPNEGQLIANYIRRTPMLDCVGSFTAVNQAIQRILTNEVDVLFADTSMPQLGGLELAALLPKGCRLVLMASTPDDAAAAFDVGATDYLIHPVAYERFSRTAARLLAPADFNTPADTAQSIFVKSDYKLMQIPLDDILFIEGLKDYIKIHLVQDQRSVMTLMSMRALEQFLPPHIFMRVHRSFIINLHHLRLIDRGRVVYGPHYIPVSESYRSNLNRYISARTPITDYNPVTSD